MAFLSTKCAFPKKKGQHLPRREKEKKTGALEGQHVVIVRRSRKGCVRLPKLEKKGRVVVDYERKKGRPGAWKANRNLKPRTGTKSLDIFHQKMLDLTFLGGGLDEREKNARRD